MKLPQEYESYVEEIQRDTRLFEGSLRAGVNARVPNNHVAIQRINNECTLLKTKVQYLSQKTIGMSCLRARSAIDSANFYIGKYEQVLRQGLELDGDILVLAGKIG